MKYPRVRHHIIHHGKTFDAGEYTRLEWKYRKERARKKRASRRARRGHRTPQGKR